MRKTFKDKAVGTAGKITKKHKWLKPLVLCVLGVVLFFYKTGLYFAANGKKYITAGIVLVFFFMSSSFTTMAKTYDSNIYLSSSSVSVNEESAEEHEEAPVVPVSETFSSDMEYPDIDDNEDSSYLVDVDADQAVDSEGFTLDEVEVSTSHLSENDTVSFDKDAWYLILVNKTHPIPDDYVVPLTTISGSMQCDERVFGPLMDMLNGAKKDGINLMVVSPYRSGELQQKLFDRRVREYMGAGMSYMDAYKATSRKVIVPGTSEHQLGMCFDIVTPDHVTLDAEFANLPGGSWLKKHCQEYGFILRYPRGKEDITGVEYESWHFRYVGIEAATYIMEHGITLEEFLEGL